MLEPVDCPYCGEQFEAEVDEFSGSQDYIEDCPACCRPIEFRLTIDAQDESLALSVRRDDE